MHEGCGGTGAMYRYRKIFKLTKVFSGVSAGVEEQAAPLRVATEVRAPLSIAGSTPGTCSCLRVIVSHSSFKKTTFLQCKEKITAFQQYLPLMTAVCNPGTDQSVLSCVLLCTSVRYGGRSVNIHQVNS